MNGTALLAGGAAAMAVAAAIAAGRHVADRTSGSTVRRRSWRPARTVVLGVGAVGAAVLWLPAPLLLAAAVALVRRRRQLLAREAARRALVRAVPEAADLALVAARAGLTVPQVVAELAERAPPPVAVPMEAALARARDGHLLADALDDVPVGAPVDGGDALRPLAVALATSARTGGPLVPGLLAVSGDAHRARAHAASLAARRVSVRLLFPLVACVLPAFVVLGLVPLLVASLQGVRLP